MPSLMGIPAVKALWTMFKQGKGLVGVKNGIMSNVWKLFTEKSAVESFFQDVSY